jgi:thiol-disulfide isomerase/thioredoxin
MARLLAVLVVVFLGLIVCSDAATKKKTSAASEKATDKATDAAAASDKRIAAIMKAVYANPMVSLTDSNFTKFVTDRPRDYHAVLMFTATAPKYQCGVCVKSMETFGDIASFYHKQYAFNTTSKENRIAFFKIEVDDGRSIFNELQLETVPRLYFLPPVAVNSPKAKISNYEVDNKVLLEGTSRILDEIKTITGVKVKFARRLLWTHLRH